MSLAIDTATVTNVLLAGEWHEVARGSFSLDSYEYVEDDDVVHGGGHSGVCATGFAFVPRGGNGSSVVSGPLTAIQAVRTRLDDPAAP